MSIFILRILGLVGSLETAVEFETEGPQQPSQDRRMRLRFVPRLRSPLCGIVNPAWPDLFERILRNQCYGFEWCEI
jgi:hypothetical protein